MSAKKYTHDHEWVLVESDGTATVGITDYAQAALGELVFIELPEVGSEVEKGEDAGVIESVKAASEMHSPVGGEVIEVNSALEEEPETVNNDPEGEGWFFKIKLGDASELDDLMDEAAYRDTLD